MDGVRSWRAGLSMRASRGNPVGVGTAVRGRVFRVIEFIKIAASLCSSQ